MKFIDVDPCALCGRPMNGEAPARMYRLVHVVHESGSEVRGVAHVQCAGAELNWQAIGCAPRRVTVSKRNQ